MPCMFRMHPESFRKRPACGFAPAKLELLGPRPCDVLFESFVSATRELAFVEQQNDAGKVRPYKMSPD